MDLYQGTDISDFQVQKGLVVPLAPSCQHLWHTYCVLSLLGPAAREQVDSWHVVPPDGQ